MSLIAGRAVQCFFFFFSIDPAVSSYFLSVGSEKIDHLRNDSMQHTKTPFPTIPGSNCMGTFRWIGREGRYIGSKV